MVLQAYGLLRAVPTEGTDDEKEEERRFSLSLSLSLSPSLPLSNMEALRTNSQPTRLIHS